MKTNFLSVGAIIPNSSHVIPSLNIVTVLPPPPLPTLPNLPGLHHPQPIELLNNRPSMGTTMRNNRIANHRHLIPNMIRIQLNLSVVITNTLKIITTHQGSNSSQRHFNHLHRRGTSPQSHHPTPKPNTRIPSTGATPHSPLNPPNDPQPSQTTSSTLPKSSGRTTLNPRRHTRRATPPTVPTCRRCTPTWRKRHVPNSDGPSGVFANRTW
mmetsp:Transcript_22620/g.47211  ORF Transcript_22620/g.47211 Transcript_22620/m.47211 type:complete len:211 (+) Transcript_22620:1011-1643(+)